MKRLSTAAISGAAAFKGPRFSRAGLLIAVAAGGALALTFALWAHYGTAVFYEMILAGLAACL